jgi:PAS domain S-box-containing protein
MMYALAFLSGAIVLQIAAATMAIRLIRVTGRQAAWILISIALTLMALRRAIPLARAILGDVSSTPDPVNEFIGLILSGFMAAGIGLIGPIFKRIFRFERELQESERRFRSYFDLPLVGVAIASSSKRWVTVNDRLCDILGFSRDELRSTSIDDMTFPEDLERERELERSVAEGRIDGFAIDKRFIRKNGSIAWTSQAIRRVRDAAEGQSYYIVILQDIAERKAAEEELRRSASDKEALLRELYHRTKNNMQIICSMLNLESAQSGDPRLTEEFRLISDKVASMSLVHEMLYVSRDLSSIDLAEYIMELCALLKQSYFSTADRIRFEIELESLRVPVNAAVPLGLILNELVTNALRHAFPDGRRGVVSISAKKGPGGAVELAIADDGVGAPPGFDFREARSMGCRTVFALVEQIGGSLVIASGKGVACRITYRPPDSDAREATTAPKAIPA